MILLKPNHQKKLRINEEIIKNIAWTLECKTINLYEFEPNLIPKMLVIGKLFVLLFLCMREEHYIDSHPNVEVNYKRPEIPYFCRLFW